MNRTGNETESFAGNFVASDKQGLFFEVPCYLYPPFWACFLTACAGLFFVRTSRARGFSLLRRPLHRGRAHARPSGGIYYANLVVTGVPVIPPTKANSAELLH